MQDFHFLRQALVFFAKPLKFRSIGLLPPLGLCGPKGFDLKPPSLQLSARDPKFLGNTALRRARLIKPVNRCSLEIIRVCSALLSFDAPLVDRGKVPHCPGIGTNFAATTATCHYTILMEAGQQAPSSINGVCESVDPDGDASVWLAAIDTSTGMGTGTLTSGTGKYRNTNPKPSFQTTYQIDATHSIYDFKW